MKTRAIKAVESYLGVELAKVDWRWVAVLLGFAALIWGSALTRRYLGL